MASFIEELWNSVFTPGTTPTLLIATNATFGALQILFLALLVATYSIHFVVLSLLSGGLWYSINWFARELQAEKARGESIKLQNKQKSREKSLDPDSETETETVPIIRKSAPVSAAESSALRPSGLSSSDLLRNRMSLGDSSDYVSTDSEWEKVSEGEEKGR